MSILTFKGGTHPPDMKISTASKQIQIIKPIKGAIYGYPLSQHIGAPCEALVSVGDEVKCGQKIAESKEKFSSPIRSSVSGKVTAIKDSLVPSGNTVKTIFISCDGTVLDATVLTKHSNYEKLSNSEILEIIKDSGIVGLGGAGFPTHIKHDTPKDKNINTIIVNAAECEPYLTSDHRVMLERPDDLIEGLKILLKLHVGARGIIAIETNKEDVIELFKLRTKSIGNIEVVSLLPKYPQGSEKQLIYACIKRIVPDAGLPADVGVIVNNVDTIASVKRAVIDGKPLLSRVVTLSGSAISSPGNYDVPLGINLKDLVEQVGGFKGEIAKVISGGPMMGTSMYTIDVPLVKTSSSFIFLTEDEAKLPKERGCIRCSRCVASCPMNLMPLELNRYSINKDGDKFLKGNGLSCIECGVCSYVCPSKRHLAQSIRTYKRDIISKKGKA